MSILESTIDYINFTVLGIDPSEIYRCSGCRTVVYERNWPCKRGLCEQCRSDECNEWSAELKSIPRPPPISEHEINKRQILEDELNKAISVKIEECGGQPITGEFISMATLYFNDAVHSICRLHDIPEYIKYRVEVSFDNDDQDALTIKVIT